MDLTVTRHDSRSLDPLERLCMCSGFAPNCPVEQHATTSSPFSVQGQGMSPGCVDFLSEQTLQGSDDQHNHFSAVTSFMDGVATTAATTS